MIVSKVKNIFNRLTGKILDEDAKSVKRSSSTDRDDDRGDEDVIDQDGEKSNSYLDKKTSTARDLVASRMKKLDFSLINDKKKSSSSDWFGDRYQTLVLQRNISIFLLIISILCVTVSGISLAIVTKAKTIEPFVIEVEKKEGLIRYINNQNQNRNYDQDELIRDYFVRKYIEARETYDVKNYGYFYHKVVKLMSSDSVYRQFVYALRSNGRENPMKLFAGNEVSQVFISSIAPLKPSVLQIRFVAEGRFGDGNVVRANKIAILEYSYYGLQTDEEKRYINPLNFIVTGYRSSDENIRQ